MSRLTFATRTKPDAGASAVEYGLVVFAIAAVIVLIVFALGRIVGETYAETCDEIDAAASTSATC